MRLVFRISALAISLALSAVLLGCATGNPDDSDLPWNTPQSWEGSPMIPGLEGR